MTERIITDSNGRKHITTEPLLHTPAQQEPVVFKPPKKWRDSEIKNGYRGIRWVAADGVYGTPTLEDVQKYLGYTSTPAQRTPAEVLDWLADQHRAQCGEDRPIQEWIRKMKEMLP